MGVKVLTDADLEKIGKYVKSHIGIWLNEEMSTSGSDALHTVEKLMRIEEAVTIQNSYLEKLLHQVDKRFESLMNSMDKRFESMQHNMDKRFEDMQHYMDKRFSQLQWIMGLGFTILAALMGIFNFF